MFSKNSHPNEWLANKRALAREPNILINTCQTNARPHGRQLTIGTGICDAGRRWRRVSGQKSVSIIYNGYAPAEIYNGRRRPALPRLKPKATAAPNGWFTIHPLQWCMHTLSRVRIHASARFHVLRQSKRRREQAAGATRIERSRCKNVYLIIYIDWTVIAS